MAISLGQFRERVQGVQDSIQETGSVSEQNKTAIRGLLADIRNIRVDGTRTDSRERATLEGRVINLADLAGIDPFSGVAQEDREVRGSAGLVNGVCGKVMGHLKRNARTYGAVAALGAFGAGWAYFGVQGILTVASGIVGGATLMQNDPDAIHFEAYRPPDEEVGERLID